MTVLLSPEGHSDCRSLTRGAKREDVESFLRSADTFTEKDDRDAVLQVIATANSGLFRKIREDKTMCEALRRLMDDDIDKEIDEAVRKVWEEAGSFHYTNP